MEKLEITNLNNKIEQLNIDDKQYLQSLEDSLLKEKIRSKDFTIKMISQFIGNKNKKEFLKYLEERINGKNFVFIRHAQAQHNEFNIYHRQTGAQEPDYFDPEITKEGMEQCVNITECIGKLKFPIELVYISPMRRTIQTFLQIKDSILSKKEIQNNNFIVTDLLREQLGREKTHIGHQLTPLKDLYKDKEFLNFDFMNKELWWTNINDEECCDDSHKAKETHSNFSQRIVLLLLWLILREEQNVCVISHSKVYKVLIGKGTDEKDRKCRAKHGGFYLLDTGKVYSVVEGYIINNVKDF